MECSMPTCIARAVARGFCKYHYKVDRYGRTPRPTRGMTLSQRLEYYTDSSGGPDACWLWKGHTDGCGYGMLGTAGGRKERAHRVRWLLSHEPPGELQVLHKCDNPACNNPRHLFLGTHKDNMDDRDFKGRGNQPKGERAAKSKLTTPQVLRIRNGGESAAALSRELKVSMGTIYHIRQGLTWRHLGEPT